MVMLSGQMLSGQKSREHLSDVFFSADFPDIHIGLQIKAIRIIKEENVE
jgi:hypothetical protein